VKKTNVIGVITARGGSKSIPGKNIAPLAGKPLIAWTIETALQSPVLDRLIVSTDDEDIASVARQWGAEVPFLRPSELAQDQTAHLPVMVHAVEFLEKDMGSRPQYVLLLQPTSPFRTVDDIHNAIELAYEKDADSVISICETFAHPYLSKSVTPDGKLQDFVPKPEGYLARQKLPPVYVLNGAIYLFSCDMLVEQGVFYTENTYAYVMPQERSLDINNAWDLYLAELILRDKGRLPHD
jgi:CMP-N-acetylneuraminic acid synthetase